jgi:ribosomal protein S18 acetylase RimI-like enzyme
MIIRKYEAKDIEMLNDMMMKLQSHFAKIDSTGESLEFKDINAVCKYMQKMRDDVDNMNGIMLVAEDNGDIVGFVQGVIVEHKFGTNIIYDTTHKERKEGWIGLLYVDNNQRGKGFGLQLIEEIKKYFVQEGCETIRVKVLNDNHRTVEIYKKYGFVYHDVVMVKKL